jgi:hypothetical protein
MDQNTIKKKVMKALEKDNGILYLRPAWIARDFLKPIGRLGLDESEWDLGDGRYILERWFGSETKADNPSGPENEGLSYLNIEGEDILLKDAVIVCGSEIMGEAYAKDHVDLGRLAKLYDVDTRISFHYHQMSEDASLVGKNSKEEAYYFPEGVDPGPHPESFFGVHPYIVEQQKQEQLLLPHLVDWNSDQILKHSRAYFQVLGEGMHLPSGVLHAPGTALTLELQENSDVFSMLQAVVNGRKLSKELLYKDIREDDRKKYQERVVFGQINWEVSGDPYFYENRNTPPVLIEETRTEEGQEEWIYYNTMKFSGKKTTVKPGGTFLCRDNGVYNIFVWQGSGSIDGHEIEARDFNKDEVLVSHEKAVEGIPINNTGTSDLILFKFFGPDINKDVPMLKHYKMD